MKIIILHFALLCGLAKITVGQQNIQFIYIGSGRVDHDSVMITSMRFSGGYPESKNLKVYYTDPMILDTLRSYISHSNYVRESYSSPSKNKEIDTLKLLDAYKITGVDERPLYVDGADCFNLFLSVQRYLDHVNLANTTAWNAMFNMIFQCHEEFLRRNEMGNPDFQIRVPTIIDTPKALVKSSN
jgi:hypothetical protein